MKITAYMPVYNEADVLPYILAHMEEQGIAVHALEGWSTDGSYDILKSAGHNVTVERFPVDGPSAEQACRPILRRIEHLADISDNDWCYLSDADEWRRSPINGQSLAQGIEWVDSRGYNVIDHVVYAFFCTDSGWTGNPEHYFHHYNTSDMICQLPQQKAWKNVTRVNLLQHGGHIISFRDGRMKKVAPEKFIMKHYPFRTPEQARQKLATRLQRRCHEEHRAGWGVHYDLFPPDFSFCWNPSDLKAWPAPEIVDQLKEQMAV